MKTEAMRPSSRVAPPGDKIAAGGERRELEPGDGGERRELEPGDGGERRELESGDGGERRELESGGSTPGTRDRRDSRWDEHRQARRKQLVDATLVAVSRHGSGVGMEEIAAAAGTSKTVVYRYFADRSDLHAAVCRRVAGQLLPRLRAAIDRSNAPRERIAAGIDAYLGFLEADPEVYRFVVAGRLTGSARDPIDALSDAVTRQTAALLTAALQGAGRDPGAADAWAHGLVGLVRSAADWWLRSQHSMLRSELTAHLTDLTWAGLSGVVTAASPRKEEK